MFHPLGFAVLGAALALSTTAFADDVPAGAPPAKAAEAWVADFDAAAAQAKKEKKDLFIDFTGSDWCGWCIRLHEEVFAHEEFLAAAKKDYVLVALDFPNAEEVKAKVPNPARNAELAKQYGIGGYPTVLLMTAEGDVFGRTGYVEGGPANYVEHIAKLRAEGVPALKAAHELVAQIKSAKGAALAAACDKAVAGLADLPEDSGLAVVRVLPVKAALAADPDNKAGIAIKAVGALLKAGAADPAVLAAAQKMDPKNEKGLLEQVVQAKASTLASIEDVKAFVKTCDDLFALGELKNPKLAKQLATNCMFMVHQHLKDAAMAKSWAKKVQKMGFEPEEEQIKALVEKILGDETPKSDK